MAKATQLNGADQDGKERSESRHGHLTVHAAETHLWRKKWQSARMRHMVYDAFQKPITEGPWITLDLSKPPTIQDFKKAAGKDRFEN